MDGGGPAGAAAPYKMALSGRYIVAFTRHRVSGSAAQLCWTALRDGLARLLPALLALWARLPGLPSLAPLLEGGAAPAEQADVCCELLYSPPEDRWELDVIFVHGLHGSTVKTWRQGDWHAKYQEVQRVPLRRHLSTPDVRPRAAACPACRRRRTALARSASLPRAGLAAVREAGGGEADGDSDDDILFFNVDVAAQDRHEGGSPDAAADGPEPGSSGHPAGPRGSAAAGEGQQRRGPSREGAGSAARREACDALYLQYVSSIEENLRRNEVFTETYPEGDERSFLNFLKKFSIFNEAILGRDGAVDAAFDLVRGDYDDMDGCNFASQKVNDEFKVEDISGGQAESPEAAPASCGCECDEEAEASHVAAVREPAGEPLSSCWPRDWLPQDVPRARVISITYSTDQRLWRPLWVKPYNRSSLEERSEEMIRQLAEMGAGSRPVLWVGHSKGGLFIKQMLSSGYEAWRSMGPCSASAQLLLSSRACVFYSVPHRGSPLASFALPPLVRPSSEILEIKHESDYVLKLHERFLAMLDGCESPPVIMSYSETRRTLMGAFYLSIVSPQSADPGVGKLYGVSLDHREICKPTSRTCFLYKELIQLIKDTCPSSMR